MRPTITVDTRNFDAAWRIYLAQSRRSLSEAINSRTFFLMLRMYILLPPKSPQAARNRILDYFNRPIGEARIDRRTGKRVGRSRQLRLVHLIAQAKNRKEGKPGLYGREMRLAAASLRRRAAGSVGYLKSAVVKAIKKLSPSFQQFGGTRRAKKGSAQVRIVSGNQALINLANQYGLPQENVSVHRGSSAYAYWARPSINPYTHVRMNIGLADNQIGNVESIYSKAMQKAYDDEAREMSLHIQAKLEQAADGLEKLGVVVK
jgi:hypothetical protein